MKKYIKVVAIRLEGNFVHYSLKKSDNEQFLTNGKVYYCKNSGGEYNYYKPVKQNPTMQSEVSFIIGHYLTRQGVLRDLGDVGPTIGFKYNGFGYNGESELSNNGFFVLWTFDHFFKTNSKLLKPQFAEEDFTNYLLAAGYVRRQRLKKNWEAQLNLGLGINFIEIDTFKTNPNASDEEFTDTRYSIISQLGLYYRFKHQSDQALKKKTSSFVGVNVFHYFMPDALAKFAGEDRENDPGGSFAFMLELKSCWN